MEFIENEGEWTLIFDQGELRLIRIDFRLTLVISDKSVTAELCIETPFKLIKKGEDSLCDPADPRTLAPLLTLINSQVNLVKIKSAGHLTVYFGSEVIMYVTPDSAYEAWQLGSSSGILLICPPEGQVVIFQKKG